MAASLVNHVVVSLVVGIKSVTVLLVLTYILIIEWNRRKFVKHKDQPVMTKRYGNITVYEAIASIFHFILVILYEVFDGLYWSSDNKSESSEYFLLKRLMYLGHLIFLQCLYCLLICRFWLLYYDILLIQASANHEWKTFVNLNYNNNDNNSRLQWFLQHKNKYGNTKWIIQSIIVPYVTISTLFFICVVIIKLLYGNYSFVASITQTIELILFTLPCFAMFYIYCKIPKLRDNYYICQELKYIIISLV
eukprot:132789_1